jgi:hypothetical protein
MPVDDQADADTIMMELRRAGINADVVNPPKAVVGRPPE